MKPTSGTAPEFPIFRLILSFIYLAVFPALLSTVTIAIRSVVEEAMLREELPGYREYIQRVKWRMIPFVF